MTNHVSVFGVLSSDFKSLCKLIENQNTTKKIEVDTFTHQPSGEFVVFVRGDFQSKFPIKDFQLTDTSNKKWIHTNEFVIKNNSKMSSVILRGLKDLESAIELEFMNYTKSIAVEYGIDTTHLEQHNSTNDFIKTLDKESYDKIFTHMKDFTNELLESSEDTFKTLSDAIMNIDVQRNTKMVNNYRIGAVGLSQGLPTTLKEKLETFYCTHNLNLLYKVLMTPDKIRTILSKNFKQ
jgi:hypothetical protein